MLHSNMHAFKAAHVRIQSNVKSALCKSAGGQSFSSWYAPPHPHPRPSSSSSSSFSFRNIKEIGTRYWEGTKGVIKNTWNAWRLQRSALSKSSPVRLTPLQQRFILRSFRDFHNTAPFVVLFVAPVIGWFAPLYFVLFPHLKPLSFFSRLEQERMIFSRSTNRQQYAASLRRFLFLICDDAARRPAPEHPGVKLKAMLDLHNVERQGVKSIHKVRKLLWDDFVVLEWKRRDFHKRRRQMSPLPWNLVPLDAEMSKEYESLRDFGLDQEKEMPAGSTYTTRAPLHLLDSDRPLTSDEIISLVPFFRRYITQWDHRANPRGVLSKWVSFWGKSASRFSLAPNRLKLFMQIFEDYENILKEDATFHDSNDVESLSSEELVRANHERGLRTDLPELNLRQQLQTWIEVTSLAEYLPSIVLLYLPVLISPQQTTMTDIQTAARDLDEALRIAYRKK